MIWSLIALTGEVLSRGMTQTIEAPRFSHHHSSAGRLDSVGNGTSVSANLASRIIVIVRNKQIICNIVGPVLRSLGSVFRQLAVRP